MDLELKDKVILITGGAKGIGAAITRAATVEGAIPVVADRDQPAVCQLSEELNSKNAKCGAFCLELDSAEACAEAIHRTIEQFGRLDGVVNNAGINDKVGLEGGSPAKFVESIGRNLLHYYNIAHYAIPYLKQTSGSIVNISSKTALTGQGGTSGYAGSKGAILALTREWAAELLSYGIRVNAILPAEVMTSIYREWLNTFPDPEKKLKFTLAKIPLGNRMTTPEEIASMAVFLLSARASHINGQFLFVDGGYVHLDRALT